MTTHHFRDLLTAETAHLAVPEKEAVSACLAYARELARDWAAKPFPVEVLHHALALKLIELSDCPPLWVRVMIAKAAFEDPAPQGDFINAAAILADRAARLLSLAA